nr:MAG TPA: hypothetical protein [Caudoviricetes sp.]
MYPNRLPILCYATQRIRTKSTSKRPMARALSNSRHNF